MIVQTCFVFTYYSPHFLVDSDGLFEQTLIFETDAYIDETILVKGAYSLIVFFMGIDHDFVVFDGVFVIPNDPKKIGQVIMGDGI